MGICWQSFFFHQFAFVAGSLFFSCHTAGWLFCNFPVTEIMSERFLCRISSSVIVNLMVAVGAAVDYLLRGAVIGAGITLDVKLFFGMLVTVWLTINELISVMENLAAIGVPGFPRLQRILKRLRRTVADESGASDEKKE